MTLPLTNKTKLVNPYKKEKDLKVKERLLLIIRVKCDHQIPYRVVKDMNRSNPWASDGLKRFDEEGIDGLKDRVKCGRHLELPEETSYRIKTILRESNQGWTTKQIEELIIKKSGIKYHYTHIYRIVKKWGFKQKVPRKVHVNTASKEEKDEFKKRPARFLWIYPPRTERLCHSIFRRIFLLLRYSGKTCLDRQGKKTCSKDNRFTRSFLFVWSCKYDGPKTVIQTVQ